MSLNTQIDLLSDRFENNQIPWVPQAQIIKVAVRELTDIFSRSANQQFVNHDCCPLCQQSDLTIIAHKDRYALPMNTAICINCDLVFSTNYFSPEFATKYYNKYAITFKATVNTPLQLFNNRIKSSAYCWSRFEWIKGNLDDQFKKIRNVLEIGTCDGANLFPFYKAGFKTIGCDYDSKRLNVGKKFGLKLNHGDFYQYIDQGYKADLIILSHVLEHMGDINYQLSNIKKLLAPSGYLYIEVPGLRGLNRVSKNQLISDGYVSSNDFLGYLQREHNYCFELRTLQAFLEKNGFQMIKGDEIVRSLFSIGKQAIDKKPISCQIPNNKIIDYLKIVEEDCISQNPWYRKKFRSLYYHLKLIKNKYSHQQ
jgi:SAM-dependent methyltransferase